MKRAASCVVAGLVVLIPTLASPLTAQELDSRALLRAPAADGCAAATRRGNSGTSVAIFVDRKFYVPLKFEITRLAEDIERDLCTTAILKVVRADRVAPTTIRAEIKRLYARRGLLGSVFIGDIPTAFWGDYQSMPPIPTDAYYEDLDENVWIDSDGNGVFEIAEDADADGQYEWLNKAWIGEHNREVWSGRLLPPGDSSEAERITQLQNYLDRNHGYRTGLLAYQRGMVYAESIRHNGTASDGEDDFATISGRASSMIDASWLFHRELGDVLDFVWSDDLQGHMNAWLAGVGRSYEYGFVNVHGSPELQWFGADNNLFGSDYQGTPPRTLLIELASCSNGNFTAANYLGGSVLFSGDALAVIANTYEAIYVGSPGPNPDHRLLSLGVTLGELSLAYVLSNDAYVLLGDPTLRLRPRASGPQVAFDPRVVFASESAAGLPEGNAIGAAMTVTNNGDTAVTLHHRITSSTSVDGRFPWDLQSKFIVPSIEPITLAPGESRSINVNFYYDGQSGPGIYRARVGMYTDSPTTPFFWVELEKPLTP